MARGKLSLLAGVAAFALGAPAASATPTEIEFGSFYYSPNDVTVDFVPGENTFEWNRNDPSVDYHSITSTGGSFAMGSGGFAEFDLRASAGTYPYYCVNHGGGGGGPMVGQVAVRPIAGEVGDDGFEVIWAHGSTETGGSFATRWKKQGQNKWKTWQAYLEAKHREFGQNDKPTDVKPGKTYLIQVRSSGPGSSKWSPSLSVPVKP